MFGQQKAPDAVGQPPIVPMTQPSPFGSSSLPFGGANANSSSFILGGTATESKLIFGSQ